MPAPRRRHRLAPLREPKPRYRPPDRGGDALHRQILPGKLCQWLDHLG